METTLIIITLLLIGAFNLLLTSVLGIALFKIFVQKTFSPFKSETLDTSPAPTPSIEEEEEIRRKRRAYEDQLTAINDMLNYNADVAYGIKPKDEY